MQMSIRATINSISSHLGISVRLSKRFARIQYIEYGVSATVIVDGIRRKR